MHRQYEDLILYFWRECHEIFWSAHAPRTYSSLDGKFTYELSVIHPSNWICIMQSTLFTSSAACMHVPKISTYKHQSSLPFFFAFSSISQSRFRRSNTSIPDQSFHLKSFIANVSRISDLETLAWLGRSFVPRTFLFAGFTSIELVHEKNELVNKSRGLNEKERKRASHENTWGPRRLINWSGLMPMNAKRWLTFMRILL